MEILNATKVIQEKQQLWRQKQIEIFYGSGRPIFRITEDNMFERKHYDSNYYMLSSKWREIDNKNYIPERKDLFKKKT